jgi:hypothetical protein
MPFAAFASACFFSTDNGQTVQCRHDASAEEAHPLPADVTNLLRLDEQQPNNAALLAAWTANAAPFSMSGNTLLVSGQPAGIDPPGLLYRALENAEALYSKAANTNDPFTREEQAQLLALDFHANGLI